MWIEPFPPPLSEKVKEMIQLIEFEFFGLLLQNLHLFFGQLHQSLRMLANLDQDKMAEILKNFPAKVLEVDSHSGKRAQSSLCIAQDSCRRCINRVVEDFPINEPEDFNDILIPDLFASVRNNLVKKALASLRLPSDS